MLQTTENQLTPEIILREIADKYNLKIKNNITSYIILGVRYILHARPNKIYLICYISNDLNSSNDVQTKAISVGDVRRLLKSSKNIAQFHLKLNALSDLQNTIKI